jgi:hypothetical protein
MSEISNLIGSVRDQLKQRIADHLESGKLYQEQFEEAIRKGNYKTAFSVYPEAIMNYSQVIAYYDIEELLFGEPRIAEIKEMFRVIERDKIRLADLKFQSEQAATSSGYHRRRVPA